MVLGVEFRTLHLLGKYSNLLSLASSPFCVGHFLRYGLPSSPSWAAVLLFGLPCMTGIIDACHHAQILVEIGSHKIFAQAGLKP
jgi:hypothetical protein